MTLPVRPPVSPMLAKTQDVVPRGDGWVYEPKWDGFRAIAFRDADGLELRSRNDRPLNRYFPEVVDELLGTLPSGWVVDGEIILPTREGLAFDALQLRLHPAASRVERLAAEIPASFVAFDALAADADDLRGRPLEERWERLAALLSASRPDDPREPTTTPGPRVYLTPRTGDADEAEDWLEHLERVGLDGVIAKRLDLPYAEGKRVLVRVKHRRTADCVVGGYRLHKSGDGVGSLLLGLYDGDGVLHFVGHTSSFNARQRRELLEMLRALERGGGFEGGRRPGEPSRWSAGKDPEYVGLEPELVCEVAYDHMQGHRFRHAATFLRWRDDKAPEACTFEQVAPG